MRLLQGIGQRDDMGAGKVIGFIKLADHALGDGFHGLDRRTGRADALLQYAHLRLDPADGAGQALVELAHA